MPNVFICNSLHIYFQCPMCLFAIVYTSISSIPCIYSQLSMHIATSNDLGINLHYTTHLFEMLYAVVCNVLACNFYFSQLPYCSTLCIYCHCSLHVLWTFYDMLLLPHRATPATDGCGRFFRLSGPVSGTAVRSELPEQPKQAMRLLRLKIIYQQVIVINGAKIM